MSESLDMALDDIIQKNKRSGKSSTNFRERDRGGGGGGGGSSRGRGIRSRPGPTRRTPSHFQPRPTPYFVPQPVHMQEMVITGDSEAGTKLYISNLDYGVTTEDIKVLFSDVGELKRYSIHYDQTGRSKGTAEVVYVRQADALAAVKRYNNVQLDGVPMKVEVVGVKVVTPIAMSTPSNGIMGRSPGNSFQRQERGGGRGQERGGNWGNRVSYRGQERGRGGVTRESSRGRGPRERGGNEKVSAADLDAELERYHLAAMQLN